MYCCMLSPFLLHVAWLYPSRFLDWEKKLIAEIREEVFLAFDPGILVEEGQVVVNQCYMC